MNLRAHHVIAAGAVYAAVVVASSAACSRLLGGGNPITNGAILCTWGLLLAITPLAAFVFGAIYVGIRNQREDAARSPGARPCWKCGYDLRGNVSGRCPECGEPVQAALGEDRASSSG